MIKVTFNYMEEEITLELPTDIEVYEDDYEIIDVETEFCESDDDDLLHLNLEELNELAEEIKQLDDTDFNHVEAYMEAISDNLEEALDNYNDFTFYEEYTLGDMARDLYEYEVDGLPDPLRWAIEENWEAVGENLVQDGYYETSYGVLEP